MWIFQILNSAINQLSNLSFYQFINTLFDNLIKILNYQAPVKTALTRIHFFLFSCSIDPEALLVFTKEWVLTKSFGLSLFFPCLLWPENFPQFFHYFSLQFSLFNFILLSRNILKLINVSQMAVCQSICQSASLSFHQFVNTSISQRIGIVKVVVVNLQETIRKAKDMTWQNAMRQQQWQGQWRKMMWQWQWHDVDGDGDGNVMRKFKSTNDTISLPLMRLIHPFIPLASFST